ncbi:MAG: endonuclease VIII [Actinomycetaceae bacterium]|nr:endonuclease VIII [Actinomycetaceae bacterium]
MPEGQAIHRHARILTGLFAGEPVALSSPQGRFASGAELLAGLTPLPAEAWGKHFFMPFADAQREAKEVERRHADNDARAEGAAESDASPSTGMSSARPGEDGPVHTSNRHSVHPGERDSVQAGKRDSVHQGDSAPIRAGDSDPVRLGDDGPLWLHIHLGLYGKWTFSGPAAQWLPANLRGGGLASPIAEPGPNVRLRLETPQIAADLSGPTRCEVLDGAGVRRVLTKLGPDPVRNEPGDRERFVEAVRSRRAPIGQLVMDQSISAGPGNIYRADCLFRVGISPLRPGQRVSAARAAALWDDLAAAMSADLDDGVIVTVPDELRPNPVPPGDEEAARFAVYHRTGRPCLRCGATVAEKDMAGRRLFWCPGCQR